LGTDAYVDALKMLARRELSEAQIRQRLSRRSHTTDSIDSAIERLKTERALDDVRVAGAIARTETHVRRRGRLRVIRQIEAAGISSSIAKRVANEVFEDVDSDALLATALEKRLRGRDTIDDQAARRLYRYLTSQGFDSDRVLAALRVRKARPLK
jgi:regulatory protein